MLVQAILSLHRTVLFAVLTVALVATGFAHHMPSAQDEALAFALANGADFCGDDPAGGGPRDAACKACQIAGSADVPPLAKSRIDLELAYGASVIFPREGRATGRVHDPANRPQGPPLA
jgi:hypothetical protein